MVVLRAICPDSPPRLPAFQPRLPSFEVSQLWSHPGAWTPGAIWLRSHKPQGAGRTDGEGDSFPYGPQCSSHP